MTLLWIAIAIAALVLIVGYFVLQRAATGRRYTRQALEQQMEKPAYREVKAPILAADGWVSAHEREDLHVMSYDGKLLHAIYLPKKDAKGTILLFHGYKSCWQIDFGLVLPYYYDTLGYSLLLVDQRAHGLSQGKYLTFGVRERLDVLSWATYMGQKLGQNAPLILGGLSMGATTVLLASCFDFPANVCAIIADCGFTSPYEIAKSVLRRDAPKAPVSLLLPLCSLVTRLFAGFGLRDGSTIDAVRESRYPILFLHGTGDTFVPYDMTKRAFDACTASKRLILVDGAEHGKSYVKEPDRVRQELKAFLDTYTPTIKEDTP